MDENGSISVKNLIKTFESVTKNSEKIENDSVVNSEIEMLKQSPCVTKYRERLQKELEDLMNMRVQYREMANQEEDSNEYCLDEETKFDGKTEDDGEDYVTPFSRSKVVHSKSTISGARAKRLWRPEVSKRTTFLSNVGIVCATKSVNDEGAKLKNKQEKLGKVLQEFVGSEKVYIRRLSVLNDSFRKELSKFNREEYLFQWDTWDRMFSNLSNIQKFHEGNLLPRLEECLVSHFHGGDDRPKSYVGKVFSELGPYLKMYSEYAQNYKRCLRIVDDALVESVKFQKMISDFEAQDVCEGLKVQYFYIEPIQRLPRYELLLREYTSCLSDDSEDLVNSHIALKIVKQANIHSNDSIKNEENFYKIKAIEDSLRDSVDLLSHPRKFLREGNVDVVLPVCGRVEERKMFLFSDLLLICQYYPHPFRPPYCVADKLEINHFHVKEVKDRIFLFGPQAIVEFIPRTQDDKMAWKKVLESVAKNVQPERFNSIMPVSPFAERQPILMKSGSISRARQVGMVAPIMMKEQNVQSCMECSEEFGLLNRKNSCYACGRVVCRQCAMNKEPLPYLNFEIKRVCNKCHDLLQTGPILPSMF